MASTSIAGLKKQISSYLLSKSLIRPITVRSEADATTAPTFTLRLSSDDDDDEEEWCVQLDPSFPIRRHGFHSDVILVPFASNQTPFIVSSSHGLSGPTSRIPWVARETDEALHIQLEMPGLSKENVKVTVLENILVIKGEAENGSNEEVQVVPGKFESELDLTEKFFKINEVNAEMKNGVLNLIVPKVKNEASVDGINVNID